MDAVREYLRQSDVMPEISDKTLNYYGCCMSRRITKYDENVLTETNLALKEKIDLEVNQQLLTKIGNASTTSTTKTTRCSRW